MELFISKYVGPCYGVSSAINEVLGRKDKAKIFGDLVHNEHITYEINKNKNLKIVYSLSEINKNDTVITRTHGIKIEDLSKLKDKNVNLIDKTCPNVKFIHKIAETCSKDGMHLVIIGNKNHPEVIGVSSRCRNSSVIESENDAERFITDQECAIVSQTTFDPDKYKKIFNILGKNVKKINVYNTICMDSINRKNEVIHMSDFVDLFLILGSSKSANAVKLFECAKETGKLSVFIDKIDNIEFEKLNSMNKVFISSASSVMKKTTEIVINKIKEYCSKTNIPFVLKRLNKR